MTDHRGYAPMAVPSSLAVELLGFFLGLLGSVGTVVATLLPHWRHTAYFMSNLNTVTSYMKGLWMECVTHSAGVYHCEFHRSMLSLPPDLQAARALMVLSSATSILGTVISAVGMQCTHLVRHPRAKVTLAASGGMCFIFCGLFCLITTSWTTNDVLADAYDPFSISSMKYQIGMSVYIGFASAVFSIFGGGVLCAACAGVSSDFSHKTPELSAEQHCPPAHTAQESHTSASHTPSSRHRDSDYV